jgi:hypothetical protein
MGILAGLYVLVRQARRSSPEDKDLIHPIPLKVNNRTCPVLQRLGMD